MKIIEKLKDILRDVKHANTVNHRVHGACKIATTDIEYLLDNICPTVWNDEKYGQLWSYRMGDDPDLDEKFQKALKDTLERHGPALEKMTDDMGMAFKPPSVEAVEHGT